jgi:hypothetical protein
MLRTEVYFKNYRNLVTIWMGARDQGYAYMNNTGNGYAYGLDLFWRDKKSIRNGEYWISYSFIECATGLPGFSGAGHPFLFQPTQSFPGI